MSCGFTLIELLVVVLIIGILAAVAVPQYQKAVKKSRAAQVDVIINTANKAIDAYLLENGLPQSGNVYLTGKDSVSTIDMPGDCSKDNYCYTDVGGATASCSSSQCNLSLRFYYNKDGTDDPKNTWLSSKSTLLNLRKASTGGKWTIYKLMKVRKRSANVEEKQAAEILCPILEKYVAEDDEQFVAYCK